MLFNYLILKYETEKGEEHTFLFGMRGASNAYT